MASSSHNNFDDTIDETLNQVCDQISNQVWQSLLTPPVQHQQPPKPKKKRTFIERNREVGHAHLWNDYFSEDPTYPPRMFRRRFRMNKPLFMRIVERLGAEIPFFQQRRDATGRLELSTLQNCTAAIRMMAYGTAADACDEYLRIAETTSFSCLDHFVDAIINCFGDE
ncbi:PREDICTED: uncharacterized protein LOC109124948 [Camelina sativa]|uniref:Uncharacterized protein LOC109124948 n=1 Tax=Camelina sativa TaxID=90675 RepID=A0ABM1QL33_CAMSA|nr:PREDICTED: uncharacterized protein LOC109124948 [Camelina sativa]